MLSERRLLVHRLKLTVAHIRRSGTGSMCGLPREVLRPAKGVERLLPLCEVCESSLSRERRAAQARWDDRYAAR